CPSGDQDGVLSKALSLANRRVWPEPSAFMMYTSVYKPESRLLWKAISGGTSGAHPCTQYWVAAAGEGALSATLSASTTKTTLPDPTIATTRPSMFITRTRRTSFCIFGFSTPSLIVVVACCGHVEERAVQAPNTALMRPHWRQRQVVLRPAL